MGGNGGKRGSSEGACMGAKGKEEQLSVQTVLVAGLVKLVSLVLVSNMQTCCLISRFS